MPETIIVTDGNERAALATVRSLGAAGHRVHVCTTRPSSLAAASVYSASETVMPDPMVFPGLFVGALSALVTEVRATVVVPISEGSLLASLPRRADIPALLPFADAFQFSRICDKREVLSLASAHGIAVPAQRVIESPNDACATDEDRFPLVIKPSRSVVGEPGARTKASVLYAENVTQLVARLALLPREAFPVLLQQRVEGAGTAMSVLIWDDELRAAFAHRRLREKPPSGGVSTLRESIPLNDDLLEKVVALLAEFRWRGVAMVEFKVDEVTGTPYMMEINGRLWGSLQLAIDAGIDFPALLVHAALGKRSTLACRYSEMRTRWEWGEIDHLLTRLFHRRSKLDLPRNAPGRLAVVGSVVRAVFDGTRAEVFDRHDWRPFVNETLRWLAAR